MSNEVSPRRERSFVARTQAAEKAPSASTRCHACQNSAYTDFSLAFCTYLSIVFVVLVAYLPNLHQLVVADSMASSLAGRFSALILCFFQEMCMHSRSRATDRFLLEIADFTLSRLAHFFHVRNIPKYLHF
jgi:hypothetical protein